jgi:NADH-quinone oxidoreductase subunit H
MLINYYDYILQISYFLLKFIAYVLPLLISVAYLTLWERKIMAAMQRRRGPNVVGFYGILQPLADGLKLLTKETILPERADRFVFLVAPILTFTLSLLGWVVIPFANFCVAPLNLSVLYILAISSLSVYGIIMSGWASNSKYAFLGALRSAAQMISYEISIGLIILSVVICSGSLNLMTIVYVQQHGWFFKALFPCFIMFYISSIAETNRPPFDLPEAEAELVSGYNVEYSAMGFALFFLAEYSNIILMATVTVLLFLGGSWGPFGFSFSVFWLVLKILGLVFCCVWVRASFPRYRYDQLMSLGWKVFLPLALGYLVFSAGVVTIILVYLNIV